MKFFRLIWSALFRKPVRSCLTLASILVAFLLFGILQSVTVALSSGIALSGADRLVVAPKYSIIDSLPISYSNRIAQLPGVNQVTHLSWFGGTYKEPQNFFARFVVDPSEFFAVFDELTLPDEQKAAFMNTRTAAIIDQTLADQYGLAIGDKIPLIPDIWPNKDNAPWEFDLVGIYDGAGNWSSTMFMNYEFFDEYRAFGQGLVGQYTIRIDDPESASVLGGQIDGMFANSSDETKTQTEKAYKQMFANQMGDIGFIMSSILSAVLFTILLLTGNVMAQAVRERIPELAILKTLGFSNHQVLGIVLAESVVMVLVGSLPGLALSALFIAIMPPSVPFIGGTSLPAIVAVQGVGLAMLLGIVVGLAPAWRAMKLSIVDALGEH